MADIKEARLKLCIKCEEVKPIDNFNLRLDSLDDHRNNCKECQKSKSLEWRIKNRTHSKNLIRNWRQANKERVNECGRIRYYRDIDKSREQKRIVMRTLRRTGKYKKTERANNRFRYAKRKGGGRPIYTS